MKKATKREQSLKIQQWYLRLSVIFALMTLFLLALTINNFYQYSRLPLTEEKTVQKNYTFAEFEKDNRLYLVYVTEEQQPLEIASVTMHPALFDALKELGRGDAISCLLLPRDSARSSYEIVAISGEESALLTLEKYNQNQKSNLITGLILSPIMTLLGAGMTAVFCSIYAYRRFKNKKKGTLQNG
ncbi:MAG: hypothetical protein IJX08_00055 [Clostridia bacterium]|nr:hypothetical protein [Clostridia bacterium]